MIEFLQVTGLTILILGTVAAIFIHLARYEDKLQLQEEKLKREFEQDQKRWNR